MANRWFDLLRSSGSIGTGGGTGVSALFNNETGGTTLKPKRKKREKPFRGVLVRKMPAKDRRYKIKPEDIELMKKLRADGLSYAGVARILTEEHDIPISWGTVAYWTDPEYQRKMREKNAKRRVVPGSEEHANKIKRDMDKRKENWKADPDMKRRHMLQSRLNDKRPLQDGVTPRTVHTIEGRPVEEAIEELESGRLKRKNRKID